MPEVGHHWSYLGTDINLPLCATINPNKLIYEAGLPLALHSLWVNVLIILCIGKRYPLFVPVASALAKFEDMNETGTGPATEPRPSLPLKACIQRIWGGMFMLWPDLQPGLF